METVLPTYTETFSVQEGNQGLIVDAGTVDGDDWTVCMVDDEQQCHNGVDWTVCLVDDENEYDKSDKLSDEGSDGVMLLDVEQFCEDEGYEVTVISENETGGNVNKIVENDKTCNNKSFDENQSLEISDEICNNFVHQDNQYEKCESDVSETDETEIEMSCDTIEDSMVYSPCTQDSDMITDSIDRHKLWNIKLETHDSEEDINISEDNTCNQQLKFSTDELSEIDMCTQGSSGICVGDVSGNANDGSGIEGDMFDIGMLPFLLQSQEQENHQQSVLDQREKTVKKISSKKKVPLVSSGCCAGCDTMMKIGSRRRKNQQDKKSFKNKDQKKKGTLMKKKSTELPRKKNNMYMTNGLHVKITDNIIGQFCLECKTTITTIEHFRKIPHCNLCGFQTNCCRAYAEHMILKHGHIRPKYENINIGIADGFLECYCGIVHLDGNKMANHLLTCEYGQIACVATKVGPLPSISGRCISNKMTVKRPEQISCSSQHYSQKETSIRTSQGMIRSRIFTTSPESLKYKKNHDSHVTKCIRKNYSHRTSPSSRTNTANSKQERLLKQITLFHNYSMPPWIECLSGTENLYNKYLFSKTKINGASIALWKDFINSIKTIETDQSIKLVFNVGNEQIGSLHTKGPVQGGSKQLSELRRPSNELNEVEEVDIVGNEQIGSLHTKGPVQGGSKQLSELRRPSNELNEVEEVDILNYDSDSAKDYILKKISKHNSLERQRRKEMKEMFFNLFELLPEYEQGRGTLAKITILKKSAELIESLKRELIQLEDEKEWLFQQQTVLNETFQQMKDSIIL